MQCSNPRTITVRNPLLAQHRGEASAKEFLVPCGHCTGCRISRSREWTLRCLHEQSNSRDSCFVTLTYDDEHLPEQLKPQDLQLFLKRLRKRVGRIRYLAVGEYGEKSLRPHYHLLLFGWEPDDVGHYSATSRAESPLLRQVWSYGANFVGTMTQDSIRYCCDYVLKSQHVKRSENENFQYPFKRQSQGLGKSWVDANPDRALKLTINGVEVSAPRYYFARLGVKRDEFFADDVREQTDRLHKRAEKLGMKPFLVEDMDSKQRGIDAEKKLSMYGEKKL